MLYDDAMTIREARARYFADNGFGEDGGYEKAWVHLWGPAFIPNTEGRKRVVPLHDLHHLATGYGTDPVGEAEMSAFELGGGCGRSAAAWVLNTMAASVGLLIAPRRTLSAFERGRRSHTLYDSEWDESMLDWTLGELRGRLLLS